MNAVEGDEIRKPTTPKTTHVVFSRKNKNRLKV
jgi:hypothetical protein